MKRIIDYTDETRGAIIAEQKELGFRLIIDQRHFDGNHLVFDDDKPIKDLGSEIVEIKARLEKLEK